MLNWQLETIWPSSVKRNAKVCLFDRVPIHLSYTCAAHQSIYIRFYLFTIHESNVAQRDVSKWQFDFSFHFSECGKHARKCPQQTKGIYTLTAAYKFEFIKKSKKDLPL